MKRWLRYALSAILTIGFLVLAFRKTDPAELVAAMARADYPLMGLSFLVLIASHYLRAMRWRYLLNPIKQGIGARSLFSGVMVGYLMNNVLPRAGEVVRPYVLARREKVPLSAALGTIVVERVMDILTFVLLVSLLPWFYHGPLLEAFPWLVMSGIIISSLVVVLLVVVITLMVRRDIADRLLNYLGRFLAGPLAARASGIMHSFLDGFLFLTRPWDIAVIVLLSTGIWSLYALMTYIQMVAFHLGSLGFGAAVVLLTISSVGVAIPTPGGTGSYHVLAAQTLTRLFGVYGTLALSFATVSHAVSFVGVSAIGAYFVWHDHLALSEAVKQGGQG